MPFKFGNLIFVKIQIEAISYTDHGMNKKMLHHNDIILKKGEICVYLYPLRHNVEDHMTHHCLYSPNNGLIMVFDEEIENLI